ncbi:PaaI family thioesterase [Methylobacterium sp. NEAU 140]|uniref:PaaI family thioesterase n=1 Tax=Methylobacterium sp. NEAU 140 TaxID=3064945 RepID=UPI0027346C9F|nr:PaaI family thioesterase [Methylobacterium sp. NEAU 140]MDP4024871.1 PaaI family thioesterase [Methylobacterium sp. NEAU 140]
MTAEPESPEPEIPDPETSGSQTFEPQTFEPQTFEPQTSGPPSGDWERVEDAGFIAHVGPLYARAADGAYAFRADRRHANLIGVVHGGMLMSVADRAMGLAAMRAADGANCVTVQLETKFVDAGRIGDWLVVVPETMKRTASLVFLRATVRAGALAADVEAGSARESASQRTLGAVHGRDAIGNGSGDRLVATADGVWKILRRRPGSG